jgi:hypothetical protein
MGYYGTVKNGAIIPEAGARLVEGERVRIEPVESSNGSTTPSTGHDSADDLSGFAVHTGIADLASRRDHYCNGGHKATRGANA